MSTSLLILNRKSAFQEDDMRLFYSEDKGGFIFINSNIFYVHGVCVYVQLERSHKHFLTVLIIIFSKYAVYVYVSGFKSVSIFYYNYPSSSNSPPVNNSCA